MIKLVAFSGSTREGSLNTKLLHIACQGAKEAGAEIELVNLKDFPMPMYDADLEQKEGIPQSILKLKDLCIEAKGYIIATPEYNGTFTPLLKNTLDWLSRPVGMGPSGLCFKKKVAVVMSASPGKFGGIRGLNNTRSMLEYLGVIVLPEQVAVGQASEAFDAAGKLISPQQQESVLKLGRIAYQACSSLTGYFDKAM